MNRAEAFAKINLALVVGPLRDDGKHEVVTVLQRIDLHDSIELELLPRRGIAVEGYPDDTLVREALERLSRAAGGTPGWRAGIEKRIPVAAGLGGGSSDAATALRLGNTLLPDPLSREGLDELAAGIGADVPFFLHEGPQLATGDGSELEPLGFPLDVTVVVALPEGQLKQSTSAVYRRFDERGGAAGFDRRRAALLATLGGVTRARDLAALPRNDLAHSPLSDELERLGAFRADVTGAGPAVYGLFEDAADAERAARGLTGVAATWLAKPVSRG
jgi:4-diphosphocytidyl-2-C-methyl-D-erythritol kinase